MKEHMLEAMKRKRYSIHQYEKDSAGPHAEGQESGEGELAPSRGSAEHDAILGSPEHHDASPDTRDPGHQNQTALGKEQGFDEDMSDVSAPENSEDMFHDTKHDTHDPVDLNRDKNMQSADENPKYDHMGVDTHKEVRHQSSNLALKDAKKNEGIKESTRSGVKSKMDISSSNASSGEEAGEDEKDAVHHNEMDHSEMVGDKKVKGFKAAHAKMAKKGY